MWCRCGTCWEHASHVFESRQYMGEMLAELLKPVWTVRLHRGNISTEDS